MDTGADGYMRRITTDFSQLFAAQAAWAGPRLPTISILSCNYAIALLEQTS